MIVQWQSWLFISRQIKMCLIWNWSVRVKTRLAIVADRHMICWKIIILHLKCFSDFVCHYFFLCRLVYPWLSTKKKSHFFKFCMRLLLVFLMCAIVYGCKCYFVYVWCYFMLNLMLKHFTIGFSIWFHGFFSFLVGDIWTTSRISCEKQKLFLLLFIYYSLFSFIAQKTKSRN